MTISSLIFILFFVIGSCIAGSEANLKRDEGKSFSECYKYVTGLDFKLALIGFFVACIYLESVIITRRNEREPKMCYLCKKRYKEEGEKNE